jgi:hypothetical protein
MATISGRLSRRPKRRTYRESCPFNTGIRAFLDHERPLIEEADLPTAVSPGQAFPLAIRWRNAGVARSWFACSAVIARWDDQDPSRAGNS